MRDFFLILLSCLTVFGFLGCETVKDPLPGKREDFIKLSSTIPIKASLKSRSIPPIGPKAIVSWPQVAMTSSHQIPVSQCPCFVKLWTQSVGTVHGSHQELFCPPVADQGVIYTIDSNGWIQATDAQTGQKQWGYSTLRPDDEADQAFGGGLGIEDSILYVTTSFGEVIALDVKTHQVIWRQDLKIPIRSNPTIADGRVFVINVNNELVTFQARTGEILWNYNGLCEPSFLFGSASPACQNGLVIAPFSSGEIGAFQPENGQPVWNTILTPGTRIETVSSLSHVQSQPVMDQGLVYAISFGGRLSVFNQQDGSAQWQSPIGSRNTPVLWDQFLFVINHRQELMCYEKTTGEVKWIEPLNSHSEEKKIWHGPLLTDKGVLVLSSDGRIECRNLQDGKLQTAFALEAQCFLMPIMVNNHLYVLTETAQLICVG
jgi:outer membrane protein assembly factor BamB